MTEEKRIINEPNIKLEITKTTGRYAKTEVTVNYSGALNEFNPDLWDQVFNQVGNSVRAAIESIMDKLNETGEPE